MIEIDGSLGEGGGQVVRSSLTLSLMTGQPFRIVNIRAGRGKPGLRPQHLKAVEAAAAVSDGNASGVEIGATNLVFTPGNIRPGKYRFDIGTAGSTSLVFQTIALPLCRADFPSTVTITGGTHVPWSPCFHYLDLNWQPHLYKLGFDCQLSLEQAGFYPQGGGQIKAVIQPAGPLKGLNLHRRGALKQVRGISAVINLDRSIAVRQRRQVVHRLGARYPLNDIRINQYPARSKGTFILLVAEFEYSQACFCALGAKGKPAERVADEAIEEMEGFVSSDGAVDKYLADQLLLPLVFASGISEFRTSKITQHLVTNAQVVGAFTAAEIDIQGQLGSPGVVRIKPVGFPAADLTSQSN